MTIDGNGSTIKVAGSAIPTSSLFDANTLPDGSLFAVKNLRIEGPTTSAWDVASHNEFGAISYQLARTWNSTMRVHNVSVTGGYGSAVLRAGGGRLEVTDSDLGGWVHAIAFFESHGGVGSMLLADTDMTAPSNSKQSSVGLYIHPHLLLDAQQVRATGWNRFAFYFNGTPPSGGTHVLVDVAAHDSALIQTGSGATTVLRGCSETGTVDNGGSFIKGELVAEDCTWSSNGLIGFLPGIDVTRRFTRNNITYGAGTWLAMGAATTGTVVIEDSTFTIGPAAVGVKLTAQSSTNVTVTNTTFNVTEPGRSVNAEGGSVRFTGMEVPPSASATPPGQLLTG
jgi:hypothetical protein